MSENIDPTFSPFLCIYSFKLLPYQFLLDLWQLCIDLMNEVWKDFFPWIPEIFKRIVKEFECANYAYFIFKKYIYIFLIKYQKPYYNICFL
jgi:hypothetical protein